MNGLDGAQWSWETTNPTDIDLDDGSCGVDNHATSQVGDAEWRCWRCGADQEDMEREEEGAP